MKTGFVTGSFAAVSLLLGLSAAAQHTIDQVAPPKSFLVVGVDDTADAAGHLRSNALWKMINAPQMQEITGASLDELDGMRALVQEQLGLDEGELALSNGGAGLAMYVADHPDLAAEAVGAMGMLDYQGKRETLQKLIEAALAEADAAGEPIDEFDLAGRTVYAFDIVEQPAAGEFEDVERGDDFGEMPGMGEMIDPLSAGMERMYVARCDDTLLFSTNLDVLRNAFYVLDGQPVPTVGDNETYQRARSQVGTGDAHAVFLIDHAIEALNTQPLFMMFAPMFTEPMGALGLDGVEALSVSADLDREGVALAQTTGVLIDGEKRGLVGLLDRQASIDARPPFISRGRASVTRVNVEFGDLLNVVNDVIGTLPPELRADAEQLLVHNGPDLQALLGSLKEEVYAVPLDEAGVFALQPRDFKQFETMLAKLAPTIGLSPRENAGRTVYSNDATGQAIGLGDDFVIVGLLADVEKTLAESEAVGEVPGPDAEFERARALIGNEPVAAWGYTDTARTIAATQERLQQAAAVGAPGMPVPPMPQLEFIGDFFGPSIWSMKSTDDGFIIESLTLHPLKPKPVMD